MRKSIPILVCPLIALAGVIGTSRECQAAITWSLADDFSYAQNSDTSTWSYRLDDNSGNYPLLTTNTRNANDLWGTTFANPPQMWSDPSGYWGIGKNLSGVTQTSSFSNTNWAPDEVLFHPEGAIPGRLVVSWLAAADMTIDVRYLFGNAMDLGNGIGYSIIHRSGATDTVLVDWGQGDSYIGQPGLASDLISNLHVKAGDRLFFRFDNWADAGWDVSRAGIFISQVPEPSSLALCALGLVGLLVCGGRKRR
jgi:PEP-CTERM motif